MRDPANDCRIVFNGEAYNFRALRKELEAQGARFRTQSDTEVVLKAWGAWGPAMVSRIEGMFALAVWDPRRDELFLARDKMGIKPLYTAEVEHRGQRLLLFASEVRSLLATGLVERRIDPVGLATYLWNGFVVGPHTIVRPVRLVPAGSSVTVSIGGRAEAPRPFWRIPTSQDHDPVSVAQVRERLESAVEKRLVCDVPLGVFLSGGVDSSVVAALAARVSQEQVRTFNVSFDESDFDESPHARAVARALGTEHHDIRLTEEDFCAQLPDALASIDQPTFDAINTYIVSRAVRRAGITVALAGTGGDELFGGYRSFVDLPRASAWSRRTGRLPEWLLRRAAGVVTRIKTGAPGEVPPQTRWGKLGDVLATRGGLLELYQVSYALFTQSFLAELAPRTPDSLLRHGLPRERADELEATVADDDELHAISALELQLFLRERLLRDTDTASMASALEVRVPLTDADLVEATAALASRDRFEPLGRKQLLRDMVIDTLDPSVFERPKSGFVLPFDVWCRNRLRDEIGETLGNAALAERVGLAPLAVGRLWRAFQSGAPGLYWSRVWSVFILLRWCETHQVEQ